MGSRTQPRFWFCFLLALPLAAQPALSDLEQAAVRSHSEWYRLAADLDVRVARMLPCDPSALEAIEETNRASTARLVALAAYVTGLAEQAGRDAAQARQIQRAETAYLTSAGTDRTDTELERARIETQLNHLLESVRKKVSLTTASEELRALEAAVRERADWITRNASAAEGNLTRFEEFVAALDRRESVIRKQLPAIEDERTKWNGYYTARLARARTECAVTGNAR